MVVHIGREIERKFQESGLQIGVFAERINTGVRNLYSIFGREDISADMLKKISDVLQFNFFSLYEKEISWISNDPEVSYKVASQRMTMSLTISADPDDFKKNFPGFLERIMTEARPFGFKFI